MEYFDLGRTLNFGHRGASRAAPANTLAAFSRAADLGADGVELDVHLSRDGHLVVIHDFSLSATTNGDGLVRDKTLAELKELDAGSWFDPAFAGERIPTLQEVVDAVGHRLLLNIELKSQGGEEAGLVAAVLELIERNHLLGKVVISSFNRQAVLTVRQVDPRVPVGLLFDIDPFATLRPWPRNLARPEALHPYHRMLSRAYVRWAKWRGYRIHTWTVDDPARMRRLAEWGVEIVITNRPDLLAQVLAGTRRA
ncbi:MAG TPA: glycerophosphodiester phosphodiesterase family protein [Anaerolineae bacterium]|nr:glycerophosphodiester phosphodiesterase family protein [Anaerolineae bacterium]